MLLIVANELDPHADAVIIALRNLAFEDILRIDFETAHSQFNLVLSPATGDFLIESRHAAKRQCRFDELKTIWWRRASTHQKRAQLESPSAETLDVVESYWAFRWLVESLPSDKFPLGHPSAMVESSNKILQLRVAADVGLKVPSSLFTNKPKALLEFASEHSDLVVKPLKIPLVVDPGGQNITLISRPVSSERMKELAGVNSSLAVYCQERIAKTADVRVNIFPSRTFACRIDNSNLAADEVDWRPTTLEHTHELIAFPSALDAACRELLRRLGLKWGALDFGLTSSDEWIFFECNPNAQWLWIELKTGLPLSNFVAQELLNHHNAGTN